MATNGEKELGFSSDGLTPQFGIALQNIASQQKANVSSRIRSIFSRRPIQYSTYPALLVGALLFVLSTSAREQPSSSLTRDSCLGDVV